jgi:hypothetical protein
MPTTTTSVTASLMSEAQQTTKDPASAPVNSAAIAFCLANADYTGLHMRTSNLQSAVALPTPSLSHLTPFIQDLLERAHSTRGVLLRDAAQEALLLFPTSVLGPQRPVASSSSVKAEMIARLDLWRRGHIPEQSESPGTASPDCNPQQIRESYPTCNPSHPQESVFPGCQHCRQPGHCERDP